MRRGIKPGGFRFCPLIVGVVDTWKDFQTIDGALSCPGCAGSMYEPQTISGRPVGLGFPHRAGRCRAGRTSCVFVHGVLEL